MSLDSINSMNQPSTGGIAGVFPRRALTIGEAPVHDDLHIYTLTVYLHAFNCETDDSIVSRKRSIVGESTVDILCKRHTTTEELIEKILDQKADIPICNTDDFEIFETMGTVDGRTFKERKLDRGEYPVTVQTLWPRSTPSAFTLNIGAAAAEYEDPSVPRNRFVFRRKDSRASAGQAGIVNTSSTIDSFLAKFLQQPQKNYADLCNLPELTEQTLLDNLKDRFNSGHIYTYIGPILVAVNPFNFFPIYNPKYSRLYCQSRRLGALPPHIYAVADITYHNMLRIKENQCVVISGESGSGKTESTNFLLHHLTTLSGGLKSSSGCSTIEQTLLSAGPVLEAFGNAVTVQNNNSSRFGKFIKVNYRENGMVSGANVEIYLLEKSRIISQAAGERNYHVFYYLLEGASESEQKTHFLLQPKDYYYLNQNNFFACDSMNEKYEYERLKHSMEAVGFSSSSQQKIFGMISAVLLLGNISFIKRPGYHSDENAYIENEELIGIVSSLLNIKTQQLHQALTMRKTVLKHDTVVSRYHVAEAVNTRDAMAKCLYDALFHWIVLRINQQLIRKETAMGNSKRGYYIGILDIFGFEDVGAQWNSFEQLCINYANEHLQAYFNQHIFQFEQEEYIKEGIAWTNIEYTDNTECVQLFQNKPYGILRLIDEESNINSGTDRSMLDKLNTFLKVNEYYEVPHKKEDAFIVAHYAGKVKYQITGFRDKNKDLMRQDVIGVLKSSKSCFVRELVGDPIAVYRWKLIRSTFLALFAFKNVAKKLKRAESLDRLIPSEPLQNLNRKSSFDSHFSRFLRGEINERSIPDFCDTSMFKTIVNRARRTPQPNPPQRQSYLKSLQAVRNMIGKKSISNKSVSRQFDYSLSKLMKTLSQATPYFIRCIKSNNEKVPNYFDDNIILRQLRYTGMLETVSIRRAGYSVRFEYESFVNQYRILLLPNREASTKEDIQQFITRHPIIETKNIQYGKSKIFMRDAEKLLLDDHLHRIIMDHIYKLQSYFRALLARRRYLKMRNGIIKLQALVRGVLLRSCLQRRNMAALKIQCWWKGQKAQHKFQTIRKTVVYLQAVARGNLQRKKFEELRANCQGKKKPLIFGKISKIHTISLPKFDLSNPASFVAFGDGANVDTESDLDSDFSAFSSMEEIEENEEEDIFIEGTLRPDEKVILSDTETPDVDATFILEDARLKLIKEHEKHVHRRQSLATTSTTKLRMMRRAASTESCDTINRKDLIRRNIQIDGKASKATHKSGFTRARKQLKALLTRGRQETSIEESIESRQPSFSTEVISNVPKAHNLKMSRLPKADRCVLCAKTISGILVQGFKCCSCKLSFHKECMSFAVNIPCSSPLTSPVHSGSTPSGKPTPRTSVTSSPLISLPFHGSFNLTKTKQQTDPTALLIESTDDLRSFSVFIFKKQNHLEQERNKRETVVDAIFKKSLREFHVELIGMEAVLTECKTVLKYRDLIATFESLLNKMCYEEKITFPTTLGVNAFRGFLNEFMQQRVKRKSSRRRSNIIKNVRKKRRRSDVTLHNDHRFKVDYVHVPTYCEICNQFMWHAEKIFICINCRLSCHKKCHTRVSHNCPRASVREIPAKNKFFGADLSYLIDEEQQVPVLLNKLLMTIEVKALFLEGIYRKSGALALIRTVRRSIETAEDLDSISFDEVPVHVLTSLVKAFFRELVDPLITQELYENFVNVAEVKESNERIRCLRVMVELLPKSNKCVLDRLMYHLARVAHQDSINLMNAANLAVIFAPCILRNTHSVHAQEQLMDVQKQAICVQALIEEKLRQYVETLSQIVELEHASQKVSENIRRIDKHRQSSESSTSEELKPKETSATIPPSISTEAPQSVVLKSPNNMDSVRKLFVEQLDFLDKEKTKLISELPPLVACPVASSEDLSSSDLENSEGISASKSKKSNETTKSREEYAIDLLDPPILGRLPNQFCQARVRRKEKSRPPSKQFLMQWRSRVYATTDI